MPEERLPHGYTNATRIAQGLVDKRYLGPDAAARQHAEVTALRHLADTLPVPAVVHDQVGRIGTTLMPGRPGQELIESAPDAVLRSVGRTAARIHRVDTTALAGPRALGPADHDAVLVHGDFGPQNLLLDPDTFEVSAIVDWEFAHLGDGVVDVAWAEWIVRTHHPHLLGALPSLFDGYGTEPAWTRRRAAMLAKCEWAVDFVARWAPDDETARAQWRDRLETTASFTP